MFRSLCRLGRLRRGLSPWQRVLRRTMTSQSRRALTLRSLHVRLLHSSGCSNFFRSASTISNGRMNTRRVSHIAVTPDEGNHEPSVLTQIHQLKKDFRHDHGIEDRSIKDAEKPKRGGSVPRSLWESATAVCIPIATDPSVKADYEVKGDTIGLSGLIRDGSALAALVAEKHAMDDRSYPVNVFTLGMDAIRINSPLKSDQDWEMTAIVGSVYSARIMVDVHFLPVRHEHSIAAYLDVLDQGHTAAPLTISFMLGIADPFNKNNPLATNPLICSSDEETDQASVSREQMKRVTASRRIEKTKYSEVPNEHETAYMHQLWQKVVLEEKIVLGNVTPQELVMRDKESGQLGKMINARRLQSTRLVMEATVGYGHSGMDMFLRAMNTALKCAENLVDTKEFPLQLVSTETCSVQHNPDVKHGSELKFEAFVTATHRRNDVRMYDRLNLFGSKRAMSVLVNVIVMNDDQSSDLHDCCDMTRVSHSYLFGLISETEDLPLILPGSYSEKILHLEGQKFLSNNFEMMGNEKSKYVDYFNM